MSSSPHTSKKGFSPEGFCHAKVLRLDNINSYVQRKVFLLSRRPLQCLEAKYFSFLADGKMRRGQFYFCPHFQRGNLANTFDHNTIYQKRNQYGAKSCTYNRSATCCYTLSRRTLVFCTTPFLYPLFPFSEIHPGGKESKRKKKHSQIFELVLLCARAASAIGENLVSTSVRFPSLLLYTLLKDGRQDIP